MTTKGEAIAIGIAMMGTVEYVLVSPLGLWFFALTNA